MRILIISQLYPSKRHPSSGIFFYNLIKSLLDYPVKILLINPRPYFPSLIAFFKKSLNKWKLDPYEYRRDNLTILRPFLPLLPGNHFTAINGLIWPHILFYLLRKNGYLRPDIIIGYNLLPEGLTAVQLSTRFHTKSVCWVIGSDIHDFAKANLLNKYLTKYELQEANLVLTESDELKRSSITYVNAKSNLHTFYKGIDIQNFKINYAREKLIEQLDLKSDRKYILFVGRLIREKGIVELTKAFVEIADFFPSVDLIFLGEEIQKQEIIAILKQNRVVSRVYFRGIITHQMVSKFMYVSDMLVLPSWAEGLPNVVMEAMASGLPVIATHVGGIPEILEHRKTGLLIQPKCVEDIRNAVCTLLNNEKLRQSLATAAQKLIKDKFDVQKNTKTLYSMLTALINQSI